MAEFIEGQVRYFCDNPKCPHHIPVKQEISSLAIEIYEKGSFNRITLESHIWANKHRSPVKKFLYFCDICHAALKKAEILR